MPHQHGPYGRRSEIEDQGQMMRIARICGVLVLLIFLGSCSVSHHEYPKIEKGRELTFPRDHFAHPEFRTEWWHYNGHLDAEDGSKYGFELVFFTRRTDMDNNLGVPFRNNFSNPAHMSHFAVIDLQKNKLFFEDKKTKDYLDKGANAGALADSFFVWNENWSAKQIGDTQILSASMKNYDLSIGLKPRKPFVLNGENGYFEKSAGPKFARGTFYIAFTRLVGDGYLFVEGKPKKVHATVWMDHEYGSKQLAPDQVGWDWFSLQFNDGSELMIYMLKQSDGTWGEQSKGTYIAADGKATSLKKDSFRIEKLRKWRSLKSGAKYTLDWHIRALPLDLDVTVKPMIDDAEINSRNSTKVIYWEGMVKAEGTKGGHPISAKGYMELCGDSHPVSFLTKATETTGPAG